MGRDKAFLELNGATLLVRALQIAGAAGGEVRIVGDRARFAEFGTVVEDQFPDRGPLGGIHAALKSSGADLNFILAVDLPFVDKHFVQFLVSLAERESAIVTVPRTHQGWQPLCGVYRREFADFAERALVKGKNKIDVLFSAVETRVVDEAELHLAGFSAEIFRNLNTPEEWEAARKSS